MAQDEVVRQTVDRDLQTVAIPGYGTAAAGAVLPIPTSWCRIFVCPNNGMAANCLGFLTCADADAHRGLYTPQKSLHWKLTGRKIPCHPGDLNLHQYCT